jgi:hypothetical protein
MGRDDMTHKKSAKVMMRTVPELVIPATHSVEDRMDQLKDALSDCRGPLWAQTRHLVMPHERTDDENVKARVALEYEDGATIEVNHFMVTCGNQELETNSLHEAEQWLWNNWSRDNS